MQYIKIPITGELRDRLCGLGGNAFPSLFASVLEIPPVFPRSMET